MPPYDARREADTVTDRPLSFWAWGYEDRLPDDDERRELADRIEGILGFPERPLMEYPSLEDVEMPVPRLSVRGRSRGS